MNCFQHIPESCGALHNPCGGAPQQRGPLTPKTLTRPNRLHTHTHPPKRLAHPRSPIPPLSTLTSRATHAHPTSPRSTGFCAIWGCTSSSSVAGCRRGGRGRGLGEGGCRSASVRPGKGCGAEHVCCSPRCRFGSGKTSEAAEGASSGGKGWRRGGIRLVLVASRSAARSGDQRVLNPNG